MESLSTNIGRIRTLQALQGALRKRGASPDFGFEHATSALASDAVWPVLLVSPASLWVCCIAAHVNTFGADSLHLFTRIRYLWWPVCWHGKALG